MGLSSNLLCMHGVLLMGGKDAVIVCDDADLAQVHTCLACSLHAWGALDGR